MNSQLSTIIAREYLERVKRKSFIISTILMPLFMVGLMVLPALIAIFQTPEEKVIAVIDESGVVAKTLQNGDETKFVVVDKPLADILGNEGYYGVLSIGANIVEKPSNATLYTHSASSMSLENYISNQIKETVESIRLRKYNIDNLPEILAAVQADVNLQTFRIDESEEASETSSTLSYFIGIIMSFMLYMFILIYGQMVMTSIIEEKNNRVLEIVVSSVKPTYLMLGKILGIGAVAVTQILIWLIIVLSFSYWVMPSLMSGVVAGANDPELMAALGRLSDGSYVLSLFVYLLLFLVGGYLFYSSIYAAIGSAVDNIQDASQLTTIAVLPIILGMVLSPSVVADPMSSYATWISIIPFTSPLVMMARIPFGIPFWEIALSIVLLYLTIGFMIWLAAKIYRVGIFMYGKKPNITELIRWARYK
ncbi:MAG: ABC transporter permease [Muribaculaceae bacterium]|nr:ABC transporter permease [Muribaculaceae bacterium]